MYCFPVKIYSRYRTLVFLTTVTLSQITPKSPEVRFLIVLSNLDHFLVHQPAATSSMHLQSTHPDAPLPPPQIYSTS